MSRPTFDIKDIFGNNLKVYPKLQLYAHKDFQGKKLPGIALSLYSCEDNTPYSDLTVSFGNFISVKNAAYIDTNNNQFAEELLNSYNIAEKTQYSISSGYCSYPLYIFKTDFLRSCGAEQYELYCREFDKYNGEKFEEAPTPTRNEYYELIYNRAETMGLCAGELETVTAFLQIADTQYGLQLKEFLNGHPMNFAHDYSKIATGSFLSDPFWVPRFGLQSAPQPNETLNLTL